MIEGKDHKPENNKFGLSDNSGKYTAGQLLAILCVITILTVGLVCCKSDNHLSLSSAGQNLVNTVAYDLNILVDYENEKIEATCGLTVENRFQHPVSRLPLVLYRLMRVTSVEDELETFYQSWVFNTEAIRDICNFPSLDDLVEKYAPAARP